MRPIVLPASTTNMGIGGAVTIITTWAAKTWGGIDVPEAVAQSFTMIVVLLLGHFTTDTPPPPVAREAVEDAAEKVDAAAEKREADKGK